MKKPGIRLRYHKSHLEWLKLRFLLKFCPILAASLLFSLPSTGISETSIPFTLPPSHEIERIQSAILKTSRGDLYFELFPKDAPWHVANFKYLADKGFYNGLKFHLFRPGYIIQAGTPTNHPDGGPGYSLPPEFNNHTYELGSLGMARMPDDLNPGRRSHGSQFHLVLKDSPHLDGSFSIFGRVIKGQEVLKRLRKGDTIETLVVYVKPKLLE